MSVNCINSTDEDDATPYIGRLNGCREPSSEIA